MLEKVLQSGKVGFPLSKLKSCVASFWRYRYLLQNLVSRDFKLKYRRSVLGVLWSVLNPLLMCLVYWVVFGSFLGQLRGGGIDNFMAYLMIGQLLFSFFNDATTASMSSVLGAAPLLKKVYIPKYIFPLEKCCFAMVNCFFSFVALLVVMVLTGTPLHATILLSWFPLITMFVFALGVGLFLSALVVFFRDVMHIWTVFTTALMYVSAVFYDPHTMLTAGSLAYRIVMINPVYWYITSFRQVALWGKPLTPTMIGVCGGCAIVSLAVGVWVFRKTQDNFVLHI